MGSPDSYLGAQTYKLSLLDGCWAWAMSSVKYVKNAIKTIETLLKEDGNGLHLKTTAHIPFPTSYRPELDFSPELSGHPHTRYLPLISILDWTIELGCIDIHLETSLLSQYLASPNESHLKAVYHISAYLKTHNKTSVAFDPKPVDWDERAFRHTKLLDWKDF